MTALLIMLILNLTEYASTTFHSSLTQKLENKLESIQKTRLRVILGVMYVTHEAALEICGLETLYLRRERNSLNFAIKCTKHTINQAMFPLNPTLDTHEVRKIEKFKVNKART